jgi:membrane protease YdiL (CAAX protease family)
VPQEKPAFWLRLLLATALAYALMAAVAERLGSMRGEAGLMVGALVLAAVLALDRVLFAKSIGQSVRELGLTRPRGAGMPAALVIGALLSACLPLAAALSGATISLRDDWLWLIPGLLAQAGLAEELIFRGLLYGRIRATRPFWRSVLLSIIPFALVHTVMFFSLPWPIAAASLALSIVMCAPLAQLYELAGRTIWAPAILHAVVQGAIKLVDMNGEANLLPLIWIGACAALPYLAFAWPRPATENNAPGV